ncbi:MAG: type II toxin-antitoxin system RelE/ParE family toxin [Deltaproteobacteria bacterium]|nr:type II toxin-antitoxin system RelE/ParE family toxin [Deltaproteobacteria bacterium]
MPRYELRIARSAEKEFAAIPTKDRDRFTMKISQLVHQPRPHGVEKLAGTHGYYRIRQGDWRVVYQIDDAQGLVVITKVGHRREVYRS